MNERNLTMQARKEVTQILLRSRHVFVERRKSCAFLQLKMTELNRLLYIIMSQISQTFALAS